jgi:hypothetical protein
MSTILNEIQKSLPTRTILLNHSNPIATEAKDAIIIIDCLTPLFLEKSMHPIQLLSALTNLQRNEICNCMLTCSMFSYPLPSCGY